MATGSDGKTARQTVFINVRRPTPPPDPVLQGLSMAKRSIGPGESVGGGVWLSGPAARDLSVSLSTDSPDAIRVPPSVRIALVKAVPASR